MVAFWGYPPPPQKEHCQTAHVTTQNINWCPRLRPGGDGSRDKCLNSQMRSYISHNTHVECLSKAIKYACAPSL